MAVSNARPPIYLINQLIAQKQRELDDLMTIKEGLTDAEPHT
jgi:hypothetical protein